MNTAFCGTRPGLTAGAVLTEFQKVMEEWNFRPWREGTFSYPTPVDATVVLLTSAYRQS